MNGLLDGRTVVVSGVGPGLGKALCLQAAAQGAKVVLAARTESRLNEIRDEIIDGGGIALAVPTDITDDEAVDSLVRTVVAEYVRYYRFERKHSAIGYLTPHQFTTRTMTQN